MRRYSGSPPRHSSLLFESEEMASKAKIELARKSVGLWRIISSEVKPSCDRDIGERHRPRCATYTRCDDHGDDMHHLAGRAHHPSLAMIRPPPLVTMTLLNRLLESGTRTPSREKEKERDIYIYTERYR